MTSFAMLAVALVFLPISGLVAWGWLASAGTDELLSFRLALVLR